MGLTLAAVATSVRYMTDLRMPVRVDDELTARVFYERQFKAQEYSTGVEGREEARSLREFVVKYELMEKRVLEIGCGRGAFQDIVDRWVGIDLASAVSQFIRKPFLAGGATALPFRGETFDAVWSIATLEHVPNLDRALNEIARVLRPGGVAYLAPAWHCRPWAADGYAVRPWSAFGLKGKLIKASIPVRNSLWFRASYVLPARLCRIVGRLFIRHTPTAFRYRALKPNYETFWSSDSDACNSMDPHEMLLWFRSRNWSTPSHPTSLSRFLIRSAAIVVRKPAGPSKV